MVKVLNPRYSLPGRKHFSATAVPKLYNEVRDKIRQELSLINKDTISVTTDCWTSIANTPYISIAVHFITSEWALKSECLACAHFDDDHNGKNIAEVLRSILSDWGIDVQNIMSITTDNGSNILKSIEEFNLEHAHISCFAHNINIGVNHSLDIPVLKRAIARLKKLQTAFAMSWKMKRVLHKAQELLQMEKASNPDNFENIETKIKEQNKKGLTKFFDVFGSNSNSENTRNPSQEAEKELNEYLSMPRVSFEHDPLDWWKFHYESFPSLKVLARKYLCIQGSILPFGLSSAPEDFQKANEIYEKDEDINPYFDDVALDSSTVEKHCR
ncbi:zinc finger BED domain-containing protein 1 [Trichonephila clavipes]|nr:zinc finger BED domain-containing protein 1 [Trichonephila clavipes]